MRVHSSLTRESFYSFSNSLAMIVKIFFYYPMRAQLATFSKLSCPLVFGAFFCLGPVSVFGEEVLVKTDFSQIAPGEAIEGVLGQALPLELPSRVTLLAGSESRATAGKEAVGSLKPPYAEIFAGSRPNGEDSVANILLYWDFPGVELDEGNYELKFKLTPLADDQPGGRVLVNFSDLSGRPLNFGDEPLHPGMRPVQVGFRGSALVVGGRAIPFVQGDVLDVTLRFDIDQRHWSAKVNEEQVFTAEPFPPQLANPAIPIRIQSLLAGAAGGGGDKPGVFFALSEVSLIKIHE